MEEKYTWVEFFEKFADKLLEYKDNRTELVRKLHNVSETLKTQNIKFEFPHVNGFNDTDPFTVFSMLSYFSTEKKNIIVDALMKEFELNV